MKVSILLASYKRPTLLNLGLQSILQFKPSFDFEILVMNDGIPDGTEEVCNKFKNELNINYFFTGQRNLNGIKKRGPAFALNIGIKQASGDIIILSCPEVYHLNKATDIVVNALIQHPMSMVIPQVVLFDQANVFTTQLTKRLNGEATTELLKLDTLVGGAYGGGHAGMPFFMAMYKKHLTEIGGYDEDFTGYAGEDNDLIERLQCKGLSHFRTEAQVVHLYHEGANNGLCHWENPAWCFNYKLFMERKGILVRNVGREWGILDG